MSSLLILTASFPYEGGEQFIESEISHWGNTKFKKVFILPSNTQGLRRVYPENISVLDYFSHSGSKIEKLYFMLLALCAAVFWKEIRYLILSKKIKVLHVYYALIKVAILLRYSKYLRQAVGDIKGNIIIYSYWNDISYYAACLLKKKGLVDKVISRAHGFDLYEERQPNNYMPLKRQFRYDADKIFLLSDRALGYYKNKYNYSFNKLEVARLGVVLPKQGPEYYIVNNVLVFLSLSYCVKIKRIDKIMNAINTFSIKHNIQVNWVHIGAGELLDELKQKAFTLAKDNKNFKADFLGQLSNSVVHNWLLKNSVDVFINSSESEGVPVSIMEAMSYGIPAIAPDIGGISDLVDEYNGFLMSSKADISEIVIGLETILFSKDIMLYRKNARVTVEDKYNSGKNYNAFIHKVEEVALNE